MWIERKIQKVIQENKDQFAGIYISGARQTGKTSLLKHLFPTMNYITFDDPQVVSFAENSPWEFLDNLKLPVILDEVQYVKNLFRYLKMVMDREPDKTKFYLTGSQHFSLMQNVSESLSGRIDILNLGTLSYEEVQSSFPDFSLFDYLIKGGYPSLYDRSINPAKWFPVYMNTYLERDVRNILNISNLLDFNRFIRTLAIRTGQILNLADLARELGISNNTAKSWISVLEASHIIYLLEPYYNNLGKRMIKSPKVYFLDMGLLSYFFGFQDFDSFQKSPYNGSLWETYVFGSMIKQFFNAGISKAPIWFWRTKTGNEVDFVVEWKGKLSLIEAKFKETIVMRDVKGILEFSKLYGKENIGTSTILSIVKNKTYLTPEIAIDNHLELLI
jgi:predicted AAA+ superfamily ATPase